MPDVDQLLDTLVADVTNATRSPGAPTAIKRANVRRSVMAVAAVAVVAAGSGLAVGALGGSSGPSSVAGPPTASPEPADVPGKTTSDDVFRAQLAKTLTAVPGWAVTAADPMILDLCRRDWSRNADGAGGGNVNIATAGARLSVWSDQIGFAAASQASDAVDRLAQNLASCSDVKWRTQPIAQTGAVLASSDAGVIWIHHRDARVSTLQVPTTDGPPPLDVQIKIADLIYSWIG